MATITTVEKWIQWRDAVGCAWTEVVRGRDRMTDTAPMTDEEIATIARIVSTGGWTFDANTGVRVFRAFTAARTRIAELEGQLAQADAVIADDAQLAEAGRGSLMRHNYAELRSAAIQRHRARAALSQPARGTNEERG